MSRIVVAMLVLALGACSGPGGSGKNTSNSGGSASTGTSGATGGSGGDTSAGGSSGSTSSGSGITADDFNQVLNTAECEFTLNCDGAAPYIESICASVTTEFANLDDLPLAIDAGRVLLNVAKASSCLADYTSGVCESTLAAAACQEAIVGNVPSGGACYGSADCQSGGCLGNDPKTCTPGTCQAVTEVGGACGCPTCGSCDPSSDLVCFNGTCARPQGPEESCGVNDPPCEPALACVDGTCVTLPVPPGSPCIFGGGQCQTGTYCLQAQATPAGNCVDQVAPGGACNEDPEHVENAFSFVDDECAGAHAICLGAGWSIDGGPAVGICQGLSDIGDPCTAPGADIDAGAPFNDGCYVGLNCAGGTCVRPPSSGPCAEGRFPCDLTVSFCASASNTCQPHVPIGGTCDINDSRPCGLGATCANGTCQADQNCSPSL